MSANNKIAEIKKINGRPVSVPPTREKPTILIIDDEPQVQEILNGFLSDGRYSIVMAGSGEDGLLRLKTHHVDIAIVDIKMPGMDGLETIERIAGIDPDIVSILITGFPTIDSSIRAIRLGASDYLLKPFQLSEVVQAVERALKESEVRREASSLRKRVKSMEKNAAKTKESIKVNRKVEAASTSKIAILPKERPRSD